MKILKIMRIIVSSVYWSRAIYFSGKGHYEKALKSLKKAESYNFKIDVELLLLKSFLLSALGRDLECSHVLAEAVDAIPQSKTFNLDEKIYLSNYVKKISLIVGYENEKLSYKKYKGVFVAQHLKSKFPLEGKNQEPMKV
jgi:tetratricopeptide (TPR) repeat protein